MRRFATRMSTAGWPLGPRSGSRPVVRADSGIRPPLLFDGAISTLAHRERATPGPIMASDDNFEVRIIDRGGHAAAPSMVVDPIVVGTEIVLALQTVVARNVDPTRASPATPVASTLTSRTFSSSGSARSAQVSPSPTQPCAFSLHPRVRLHRRTGLTSHCPERRSNRASLPQTAAYLAIPSI